MTHGSPPSAANLPEVLGEAFPHGRAETRRSLATAATVRTFGAGHTIARQGDESLLALVLDGYIAVRRTTVDGRQLMVRIVTRGNLASIFPLAGRPAAGDSIALTPGVAAVWRGDDVRSLATADPGLAVDLLDQVLVSFEDVVTRLDGLLYQDALRRVARVLHFKGDLFFAESPVLKRTHLPTLVGTSREMTGRVLRILESRGLVARVDRDRLRLLDPAGLGTLAESGSDPSRTRRGPASADAEADRPGQSAASRSTSSRRHSGAG